MKGLILCERETEVESEQERDRDREICCKLFCFKLITESSYYILKLQRQQAKIMGLNAGKRKLIRNTT